MQYVYFSSQDSRNDQESTTYMIEHMWKNVRPENQEEHRLESKGEKERLEGRHKRESCHGNRENIFTPIHVGINNNTLH